MHHHRCQLTVLSFHLFTLYNTLHRLHANVGIDQRHRQLIADGQRVLAVQIGNRLILSTLLLHSDANERFILRINNNTLQNVGSLQRRYNSKHHQKDYDSVYLHTLLVYGHSLCAKVVKNTINSK